MLYVQFLDKDKNEIEKQEVTQEFAEVPRGGVAYKLTVELAGQFYDTLGVTYIGATAHDVESVRFEPTEVQEFFKKNDMGTGETRITSVQGKLYVLGPNDEVTPQSSHVRIPRVCALAIHS